MKTIHLILNSHIDPIWLWPWTSGLDTLLNTCRTVCDLLDEFPSIVFTRGEAWAYLQIELLDPVLFARICDHVAAHRWATTGGWWIQPDCNAPSGFAIERQIALGQQYFREKFGAAPAVAYNVDSFGHATALPTLMHAAGQKYYVMMRPQEHELTLPGSLFRWREHEAAPEIVTFRIPNGYTSGQSISARHMLESLKGLPDGIDHTMNFIGIGDHGGAPSRELICWCLQNTDTIPGVRLIFSSPEQFFAAIQPMADRLPVVTGEMQMHAVGCYSVYRSAKLALRRAEHWVHRAESQIGPSLAGPERAALDAAWEAVCFHQFHDTLGGTCVPSAYGIVEAQLNGAAASAEEMLHRSLRQEMSQLAPSSLQRLILQNASDTAFEGPVYYEPWLEPGIPLPATWGLKDIAGNELPFQIMDCEAAVKPGYGNRLVFYTQLEPHETKIIECDFNPRQRSEAKTSLQVSADKIQDNTGLSISIGDTLRLQLDQLKLPQPELHLLDDHTDTWSHDIDRYATLPAATAKWDSPILYDRGPVMASILIRGTIGKSQLLAEYRMFAGQRFIELILRVTWFERHCLLKMVLNPTSPITDRIDGTLGGTTVRTLDSKERPMQDYTLLSLTDGNSLGIVAPDVFALDANPTSLRLTLLRSPLMAHHVPHAAAMTPRAMHSDQGIHEFRFRLLAATSIDELHCHAMSMHRPPLLGESTLGMYRREIATEFNS